MARLVGYPHPDLVGIEPKLTQGIVNARTGIANDPRIYQISVPLQRGNSSGPLINMRGEVMSVVTAKMSAVKVFKWTGDMPQNVSYAVKSGYIQILLSSIDLTPSVPVLPAMKGTQIRRAPATGNKGGFQMIEKIPGLPDNVLGFSAKETVTANDYESVIIPAVENLFSHQNKVRFLYHLGEDFTSFEAAAMWDDTKLGLKHFTGWERMAVVSDVEWIRAAIKIFGLGIPGHVRVFHNSELAEATQWISE